MNKVRNKDNSLKYQYKFEEKRNYLPVIGRVVLDKKNNNKRLVLVTATNR